MTRDEHSPSSFIYSPHRSSIHTMSQNPPGGYSYGHEQSESNLTPGPTTAFSAFSGFSALDLSSPYGARISVHDQSNGEIPWYSMPNQAFTPMSTDSDLETIHPGEGVHAEANHRLSIYSDITTTTVQGASTIRAVHGICLAASRGYLMGRQLNTRLRGDGAYASIGESLDDFSSSCREPPAPTLGRTSDQSTNTNRGRQRGGGQHLDDVDVSTDSLLANVSIICSGLWGQSQRDRLHVPNTERVAVENMACLLEWAETVVVGDAEANHDAEDWVGGEEHRTALRVLAAGKNLCSWLGDDVRRAEIAELDEDVQW